MSGNSELQATRPVGNIASLFKELRNDPFSRFFSRFSSLFSSFIFYVRPLFRPPFSDPTLFQTPDTKQSSSTRRALSLVPWTGSACCPQCLIVNTLPHKLLGLHQRHDDYIYFPRFLNLHAIHQYPRTFQPPTNKLKKKVSVQEALILLCNPD